MNSVSSADANLANAASLILNPYRITICDGGQRANKTQKTHYPVPRGGDLFAAVYSRCLSLCEDIMTGASEPDAPLESWGELVSERSVLIEFRTAIYQDALKWLLDRNNTAPGAPVYIRKILIIPEDNDGKQSVCLYALANDRIARTFSASSNYYNMQKLINDGLSALSYGVEDTAYTATLEEQGSGAADEEAGDAGTDGAGTDGAEAGGATGKVASETGINGTQGGDVGDAVGGEAGEDAGGDRAGGAAGEIAGDYGIIGVGSNGAAGEDASETGTNGVGANGAEAGGAAGEVADGSGADAPELKQLEEQPHAKGRAQGDEIAAVMDAVSGEEDAGTSETAATEAAKTAAGRNRPKPSDGAINAAPGGASTGTGGDRRGNGALNAASGAAAATGGEKRGDAPVASSTGTGGDRRGSASENAVVAGVNINTIRYMTISEVGGGRFPDFSPDVFCVVEGPKTENFWRIGYTTPIATRDKTVLEDVILGSDVYSYNRSVDYNDALVFKNITSIYRLNRDGFMEYNYIAPTQPSDKGGLATALKNASAYIINIEKKLLGKTDVILSGIYENESDLSYRFVFDYIAGDYPVYFKYRQTQGDSTVEYENAINITANANRVLTCRWMLVDPYLQSDSRKLQTYFDRIDVGKSLTKMAVSDIAIAYTIDINAGESIAGANVSSNARDIGGMGVDINSNARDIGGMGVDINSNARDNGGAGANTEISCGWPVWAITSPDGEVETVALSEG